MTVTAILEIYGQNTKWIEDNLEYLSSEHSEKYIAVADCAVIASGDSIPELLKVVESQNFSMDEVAIEFITRKPRGMLL